MSGMHYEDLNLTRENEDYFPDQYQNDHGFPKFFLAVTHFRHIILAHDPPPRITHDYSDSLQTYTH